MDRRTTFVHQGCETTELAGAAGELLAMMAAHDPATAAHLDRVGTLARRIGGAMGFAGDELELLAWAGRLHDIGKLTICPAVLRAPGPLCLLEAHRMARQPVVGALLVKPLPGGPALSPIVRWHRERLDGSGDPDGLVGAEIPLAARIVAVADAFDAMTSPHPYRVLLSPPAAIAKLSADAGRLWDGEVIVALLNTLGLGAKGRPAQPRAA